MSDTTYLVHSTDGQHYRFVSVHRSKAEAVQAAMAMPRGGAVLTLYEDELLEYPFPIEGIDLNNLPQPQAS